MKIGIEPKKAHIEEMVNPIQLIQYFKVQPIRSSLYFSYVSLSISFMVA